MDRKKYGREWRRRKYERRLAVLNRGAMTCQRRFGRFGICGGALHVGGVCHRCERLKLGLCADCPAPVAGMVRKARRCAACAKRAFLESMARYRETHRALVNRRAKNAARKNRQRNADYKRLWRAANRDKMAAQKRRYSLRQPPRRMRISGPTDSITASPRHISRTPAPGSAWVAAGRRSRVASRSAPRAKRRCGECSANVGEAYVGVLRRGEP